MNDDGVEIFENITTLNEGSYLEVEFQYIILAVHNAFALSSSLGS